MEICVTITGINYYLGFTPYKVGRTVRLTKEPDNANDAEAIRVELPFLGKIGYVANSTRTVYDGTYSAGRLYDRIGEHIYAKVQFITHSGVIARILPAEANSIWDPMFNMRGLDEEQIEA